jgi:hypothetical protein
MHIQHIESTSDHTGNFSGPPPPPSTKQSCHWTPYCGPKVRNLTQTLIHLYQLWYLDLLGDPINIPLKIGKGLQSSFSLGVYIKGIDRTFNWHKCLGGILHFKPTAGCQILILIYGFFSGGGPYKYPMKNCQRTEKFFLTWGLHQRYCTGL